MHPASELLETKSKKLSGKTIVVGVTGSIAAVESVKLIHELIRHGANVIPVLTEAACDIINPEALKCASGNIPITRITGDLEHVSYCGLVKDKADLLLIAPSTANTISKIANGIDDTTVTTFATTAIGSGIPLMIVPAMHGSMYEHPILIENMKKLKDNKLNIEFIEPIKAEQKYKIASINEIVSRVIRKLWKPDLKKNKVLIIAGSTSEAIDDMRVITNRSTGVTGLELANMAFLRGAEVKLWLGKADVLPQNYLNCERFSSVNDLKEKISETNCKPGKQVGHLGDFQIIIVCAAISDYTPLKKLSGKVPSGKKKLSIDLIPTPKIIELIRKRAQKSYLVGFKAESKLSEQKLIEKAYQRKTEWNLDLIVANDLSKVSKNSNQIYIIHSPKKFTKLKGNKEHLAEQIFDFISEK